MRIIIFTIACFSPAFTFSQINHRFDTLDFQFHNSRNETLTGRLIAPDHAGKKLPVLLFLVGSANSSFKTNYKEFLKDNFENQLLDSGVALCYFDKPGIGTSQGKWYKQTFYDRAADANACIDFLSTLSYIDKKNIGVAGHSQGGWIAQLVAAQYPDKIKYAISLAGPTYSVKKQLISDFESTFKCSGIEKDKAHRKAVRKTNFVFLLSKYFPVNPNLKQLKKIRNYTPDESIRKIEIPFLFLFGQNDRLVYADWCTQSLQTIFKSETPTHLQYLIIKDANHSFEVESICGETKRKGLPYAIQFQSEVKNYILKMTR